MRYSSKLRQIHILILTTSVLTCATDVARAQWATLKGQFIFGDDDSPIPAQPKIIPRKDVVVCGKNPLFGESLVINPENRGIQNIVLWAYKPTAIHPQLQPPPQQPVNVDNLQCRFEPHVSAVRTQQPLVLGNLDDVAHSVMLTFFKNQPIGPIVPPKQEIEFTLTKAEPLPTRMSCPIHPWMMGWVLVQDHPYMAVTDRNGKFEIKNLPVDGKLTLKVWHEKIGYVQEVQIDGKQTKWKRGRYTPGLRDGKVAKHLYRLAPKLFAKK